VTREATVTPAPLVFRTSHRIRFSQLDPYQHMGTEHYPAYFLEHRMTGLRERIGWDLKALTALPFAVWVKRMELDFVRPAVGDQEIAITSFVREFRGSEAHVECRMTDETGREVSRCMMIIACVDKVTSRPIDWPADAQALFFERPTG
jgi:acyl-CoA thioester hydrolase